MLQVNWKSVDMLDANVGCVRCVRLSVRLSVCLSVYTVKSSHPAVGFFSHQSFDWLCCDVT